MNTIDKIMALADEYVGRSQLTEQGEILSREALHTALTELASTTTEYQQAADKTTETKHKEHITSEHFGIPTDFADRAENYAAWRVQALSEQLAEALALIEVSRKQEPVAWKYTHIQSGYTDVSLNYPEKTSELDVLEIEPLFAAPVVAPDMLSALKMAVLQNSHDMLMTGEEIRKCESAINAAIGGAT